jgi:excisionase family DNA binding protein
MLAANSMSTAQSPATLTVNDVHNEIGRDKIARATLYLAISRGDLPSVRLGKRILIPRDAFHRWLNGGEAA